MCHTLRVCESAATDEHCAACVVAVLTRYVISCHSGRLQIFEWMPSDHVLLGEVSKSTHTAAVTTVSLHRPKIFL